MMMSLPTINRNDIYNELRGETCRCGREKRRGKTFCTKCYFALSEKLRDQLYQLRGYTDTYREACAELDRQKQKS